ncbi:uncharacterized protein [Linepithema humile]|uniref:uncharacterized protein isoform X4 n=1 Tax=Linepithema humile TaxID=83485 RepID=UPI00351DEB78
MEQKWRRQGNAELCSARMSQSFKTWHKNAPFSKESTTTRSYHFPANMWEKERVDGKKKLKVHAIPTIFGHAIMQMQNNRASEHRSNARSTQHSPILVYTDPSSKDVVILSQCDETGHYESTEPMQESLLAHLAPSNKNEINNVQQENKEVDAQHQETCTNIHASSKQTFLSEDVPLEENECDIISNDESVHKQEVELLTAQKKFATSDCNCGMAEKYKKLEKLYLKSERSKVLMKKNHNRLQVIMKRKIMKLEKIVRTLPSLRTLHRNLEKWKFQSGLSTEIFEFLRIKVSQFKNDIDKDCCIVLDEISISPGKWFDTSTNTYVGVAQRWKQTVAYFYSGNSTNGSIYKSIILNIIEEANKIGLRVQSIVSDMSAPNQAMWKSFNINVSRYSTV